MTAGSVDLAVEAMRRRARFHSKSRGTTRLLAVLRTQVELGEALRRGRKKQKRAARQCF